MSQDAVCLFKSKVWGAHQSDPFGYRAMAAVADMLAQHMFDLTSQHRWFTVTANPVLYRMHLLQPRQCQLKAHRHHNINSSSGHCSTSVKGARSNKSKGSTASPEDARHRVQAPLLSAEKHAVHVPAILPCLFKNPVPILSQFLPPIRKSFHMEGVIAARAPHLV